MVLGTIFRTHSLEFFGGASGNKSLLKSFWNELKLAGYKSIKFL
jgi:hypothetical protein